MIMESERLNVSAGGEQGLRYFLLQTNLLRPKSRNSSMADALAVVGLGLGVASLLLQVTDECIKSKNPHGTMSPPIPSKSVHRIPLFCRGEPYARVLQVPTSPSPDGAATLPQLCAGGWLAA